jgi:hypothetical protein
MSGQRGARRSHARRKRTRARRLAPIIASVAAEVVGTWLRSGRTVVTPVKEADLSDGDRHAARQMHDVRVP